MDNNADNNLIGVSFKPGEVYFHRSGAWVKVIRDDDNRYYLGRRVFYKPEVKEVGSEIDTKDVTLSKRMTYRNQQDALSAAEFEGVL
jgi:hypothetical protein